MRKFIFPLASALLVSCGGGGSGYPAAPSATNGACALPYYSELIGTYSGALTRDSGVFLTDLEVSGNNENGMCALDFNMSTASTSTDVGIHGIIRTDVDIPGYESFWSNPVFPVDAWAELRSATPEGKTVFGEYSVNVFVATFGGQGGVTLNEAGGELRKE